MDKRLEKINELAMEIMHEIDGLLDGDEPEPTIFRQAREIMKLSEK